MVALACIACTQAPEDPIAAARADLSSALREDRLFEAHLSATGLAAGIVGSRRRGTASTDLSPALRLAAARLESAGAAQDDAAGLAARGLAKLVAGDSPRAVALLEDALAEDGVHPDALTDLSATYLVRGTEGGHVVDLVRALDVAERAARARRAGAVNRALALEAVGLHAQAARAWDDALGSSRSDGWRRELAARRDAARTRSVSGLTAWERARNDLLGRTGDWTRSPREMVALSPQWSREALEDELLPAWAAARIEGDPTASAELRAGALRLAEAIANATGSRWTRDIVDALRGDDDVPEGLARAFLAFGRGRRLTDADRWLEAQGPLEDARRRFEALGHPMALATLVDLASAAFLQRDLALMDQLVSRLERQARARDYASLLGRALWLRGNGDLQRGRGSDAVANLEAAIAAFARAGERANEYAAHNFAASNWRSLGEHTRAWRHLAMALQHVDTIRSPRRRYVIFFNASLLAARDGLMYAALRFQDAAVDTARARGSSGPIVESLIRRARLLRATGAAAAAMADVGEAEHLNGLVDEPAFRTSYAQWLRVIRAEVAARARPEHAYLLMDDKTIGPLADREREEAPHVYGLRAELALSLGRADDAAKDLETGSDAVELVWSQLKRDEHRLGLFDDVADLFTRSAALKAARGDADGALVMAERSRGRALAAALGINPSSVSLREIQRALAADTAVVLLVGERDELTVLTVTKSRLARVRVPLPRSAVHRLARRLDRGIRDWNAGWQSAAESLFDALLSPIRSDLVPGGTVVFVPEGPLHRLPFAALRDRRAGRLLIEDYSVVVAPSAAVFAELATRARVAPPPRAAVVVAVPDAKPAERLPRLPAAEREADAIAREYEGATLLRGKEASVDAVIRHASGVQVVHVAAHAVADERNPEASRLLLGEDSQLRASSVTRDTFGHVSLVVLGACSTADGDVYRTEGVMSLARPFLAAGVPSVVAALWEVDDEASSRIMPAFHRAFRRQGDAASALRSAQRDAIASRDPRLSHPAAWAVFELLGATALRRGAEAEVR